MPSRCCQDSVGAWVGVVVSYLSLLVGAKVGLTVGGIAGISAGQELHVFGQFLLASGIAHPIKAFEQGRETLVPESTKVYMCTHARTHAHTWHFQPRGWCVAAGDCGCVGWTFVAALHASFLEHAIPHEAHAITSHLPETSTSSVGASKPSRCSVFALNLHLSASAA